MSLREKLTGRRTVDGGRRSEKRQAAVEREQGRAARRAEVAEQARAVRESMRSQAAALEMAPSKQTPGTFVHLYSSRDDAMSVFADAAGHMVAVPTARLA